MTRNEVNESYEEFRVTNDSNLLDHAKFLRSLLPRGTAWEIELPKEQQIDIPGIKSQELFGAPVVGGGIATVRFDVNPLDLGTVIQFLDNPVVFQANYTNTISLPENLDNVQASITGQDNSLLSAEFSNGLANSTILGFGTDFLNCSLNIDGLTIGAYPYLVEAFVSFRIISSNTTVIQTITASVEAAP